MPNSFELVEYAKKETLSYDLFISTTNKEERTNRGQKILEQSGVVMSNHIAMKFENSKGITKKPATKNNEHTVTCSYYQFVDGVKSILESAEQLTKLKPDSKMAVDITGFIAPYLFYFLKQTIVVKKINNLDIIYTAPLAYKKSNDGYPFSEGIDQIREIADFYGMTKATNSKLLISILGFEGYRSLEVLKELEPDRTIALNGFPPYSLEYKDTSILANKDLLNSPSCLNSVEVSSAHDPIQTIRVLEKIYDKKKNEFDITISPLGTKPMSLGACIFCLKHDDVRVVFPYPISYSEEKVSKQYGKTWIYRFTDLNNIMR